MYFIQPNTLYSVSLIYFFWAATAFDIFGTDNAEELLTCGFQYPSLPVKKLGSPCQDMKPGPQGVRILAKLGSPCQDMKPGPQGVRSLAKLGSPQQDMNPGPQGVGSLENLGSLCQDMKPGPQGLPRPAKVGSPCQDMKPGPRELAFRKNLNLRVRT